jgi:hypothetical protein
MQGRSPQLEGLITLGWVMPVKGKPKPSESGHWLVGCHSIAQLIMSDLHTSTGMGDDIILQW